MNALSKEAKKLFKRNEKLDPKLQSSTKLLLSGLSGFMSDFKNLYPEYEIKSKEQSKRGQANSVTSSQDEKKLTNFHERLAQTMN